MIGFGCLLVVLFVLYVVECAVWIPSDTAAFRLTSNEKSPIRMVTKPRVVTRSSVAFSNPLSFRSAILVCSSVSASISPDGIVCGMWDEFLAFEDMSRIESSRRSLLINGAALISASSEAQASDLAQLLRRLCKQKPKDRANEIEKYLADCLDADRAGARVQEYADESFNLNLDSFVLFLATFVVSPIVVWRLGLPETWPFLLLCLLLNVSVILWDFRRTERKLFPKPGTNRWETMVTILLSPPVALHATKYLARDIAADYHPLAIAAARCSDEDFETLASWVLRQLMFVPDINRVTNDRAADCSEWFRHELHKQVSSLVRSKGRCPELLVAPPPRGSQNAGSYCPRCWSQFVVPQGACIDCGGVTLRSFDEHQ